MREKARSYVWLITGCALFAFIGWKWNIVVAAWIAPALLLRFFRGQRKWYAALPAYPLLMLASFAKFTGTWGEVIGTGVEAAISAILPIPLLAALFADRYFRPRTPSWLSLLIFPSSYVVMDFLFGLIPRLGTSNSITVSQFPFPSALQVASIAGIWGVSFALLLAASAFAAWWEKGFPAGRGTLSMQTACGLVCFLLVAGGFRLSAFAPKADTVKVAGITVGLPRNYWEVILDRGVPREGSQLFKKEFSEIETSLFAKSDECAAAGAKIVFWSEGNLFVYEDDLDALLAKACAFARERRLYFAPSLQVLHFDSRVNDARSVMITPEGEIAYTNNKHESYYPTNSDGVIHYADTPYGRIASAICFDMDFPAYIRQAGKEAVDIMLVPAYDTRGGSPFHSYSGLLRGIENGFSVFRSVNSGTSLAVDYEGQILAQQDFFHSRDGILFADVPMKGIRTPYSRLGDWLAYAAMLILAAALVLRFAVRHRARKEA